MNEGSARSKAQLLFPVVADNKKPQRFRIVVGHIFRLFKFSESKLQLMDKQAQSQIVRKGLINAVTVQVDFKFPVTRLIGSYRLGLPSLPPLY